MITDTRFLTIHPRTALWHEQRKQCKQCEHIRETGDLSAGLRKVGSRSDEAPGMRCARLVQKIGAGGTTHWAGQGRSIEGYCIDAREEGAPCGPEGKLFERKYHATDR